MRLIKANEFAAILAARYGVSAPAGDLETAYNDVRALTEREYSPRIHEMRVATKRLNCNEDNFTDKIKHKRFAVFLRAVESATARMNEYDEWTRYKHLLSILTGRYDGRLSYASDPEYGRFIRIAYAIRRRVARAKWAAAVAENQAEMARKAAYEASIAEMLPPSSWGKSLDSEKRLARWFSLPLRERHGEIRSAILKETL